MDVIEGEWLLLFDPLALGTGWFEELSLGEGELQFQNAM
jgi:hypothetical protein